MYLYSCDHAQCQRVVVVILVVQKHVCMKVLEPIADEQLPMNAATAVILRDTLACLACKVY